MHRALVIASFALATTAHAEPLRLDSSLGFSNIQQQAKQRVATPRGDRLVESTAFTLAVAGAYDVHRYLAVGAFAELDLGVRRAGELVGFDASGRAMTDPAIGGRYTEIWAGPVVRGQWRSLFLDLGYGLFVRRWDSGRPDLANASGTASGAFSALTTVRWVAALGGTIRVRPCLSVVLRLEWRIRYYDERDGQPLMDDIIHGTQEYRPLVGVAWQPRF